MVDRLDLVGREELERRVRIAQRPERRLRQTGCPVPPWSAPFSGHRVLAAPGTRGRSLGVPLRCGKGQRGRLPPPGSVRRGPATWRASRLRSISQRGRIGRGVGMDGARRFERRLLGINLVLLAVLAAIVLWTFWALVPKPWRDLDPGALERAVSARGDLAQIETTTIGVFRAASPSVVHITTLVNAARPFSMAVQQVPEGTGSGFVWDTGRPCRDQLPRDQRRRCGGDRARRRHQLAGAAGRRLSGEGSGRARGSTPRAPSCSRSRSAPPPGSRSARWCSRSAIRSASTRR